MVVGGLLVGWLSSTNLLLNLALPGILNGASERVHVRYRWAFMGWPGQVLVYGLDVHSRGLRGEVIVRADRASGQVWLFELWDRRFRASELWAQGVTFQSIPYADAPVGEALTPGLDPADEWDVPGAPRWTLRLDDIVALDLRELRFADYQLIGQADVSASVLVEPPFVDLDAQLTFTDGRIAISGDVVADRATGEAVLNVRRMDRRLEGSDRLPAVSGRGILEADVRDLRFLDFYLENVPWLSFGGVGTTRLAIALDEGKLAPGTQLDAQFPDLVVRLIGTVVRGAGTVRGWAGTDADGSPISAVDVDLRTFNLRVAGAVEPLLRGDGLHIDLRSSDVALYAPFAVDVAVVLPPSHIPEVSAFNSFLPADVGFELRSGEATVSGELHSRASDGRGFGELHLASDDLRARVDDLDMVADVEVQAVLVDANFDAGEYGLEGTQIHLRRVAVRDRTDPDARFESRDWSSSVSVSAGAVRLQDPIYFDLSMNIRATDSGPFIAVVGQKQPLPGWASRAMTVDGLAGEGRIRLGPTSMELGPFALRGGNAYELKLRYLRDGPRTYGAVFTRAGPLSLGIGLDPTGSRFHPLGASRWFDEQEATRAWRP